MDEAEWQQWPVDRAGMLCSQANKLRHALLPPSPPSSYADSSTALMAARVSAMCLFITGRSSFQKPFSNSGLLLPLSSVAFFQSSLVLFPESSSSSQQVHYNTQPHRSHALFSYPNIVVAHHTNQLRIASPIYPLAYPTARPPPPFRVNSATPS